jgi:hypothetical protein
MKLILVDDDGAVLDTTDDFTRADWDAVSIPHNAWAMLGDLYAGPARQKEDNR